MKVSSKFPICNLPLRLDSYQECVFNCKYCFSNNRRMGYSKKDSSPNIQWLKNKFTKVYDNGDVDNSNFLEVLLDDKITLHGGGQSDCFQSLEKDYHHTRSFVELCNEYDQKILFSTKSDTYYNVPVTPELHSVQLSITNTTDNPIEANVPSFSDRYAFYRKLVDEGFLVGVRIQPFIPNVSDVEEIIRLFGDYSSHFTLESIKFVPGNPKNTELMRLLGLNKNDLTQLCLLNLKPSIRLRLYEPIIELFEDNGLSYSIADNDLHYMGNNHCCCGDDLISKGIMFANTRLIKEYGCNYNLDDVFCEAKDYLDCKCSGLFNSDRRNGCVTVRDFYMDRFDRKSAIFSPSFQFVEDKFQSRLI